MLMTVILLAIPVPLTPAEQLPAERSNELLWYRQPAEQWIEALAVGNGRLGAMIFGKTDQERIQFNEDTWVARFFTLAWNFLAEKNGLPTSIWSLAETSEKDRQSFMMRS